MDSLETRIQYHFRQTSLLTEALTHPSLRYETRQRGPDNQRLEFLGDAVLQLALTEVLFQRLPLGDEGVMTKLRTRLVSERTLARLARELDLGKELRLSKGEEANGGRNRDAALSDALEALIGAIYLDGHLEAARAFVLRITEKDLKAILEKPVDINPKGQLQELLQGIDGIAPTYEIVHSKGPDHQKHFRAAAVWRGRELGFGEGPSKKDAQIEAAKSALAGKILQQLLAEIRANLISI